MCFKYVYATCYREFLALSLVTTKNDIRNIALMLQHLAGQVYMHVF